LQQRAGFGLSGPGLDLDIAAIGIQANQGCQLGLGAFSLEGRLIGGAARVAGGLLDEELRIFWMHT